MPNDQNIVRLVARMLTLVYNCPQNCVHQLASDIAGKFPNIRCQTRKEHPRKNKKSGKNATVIELAMFFDEQIAVEAFVKLLCSQNGIAYDEGRIFS